MAIIDDVKNKSNETIYPRTLTKAVYDIETNKNLDEILLEKKIKVGNTSSFTVERQVGLKIEVSFGDPGDSVVINESGERVTLAEWDGTQLRAKLNSDPVDENDGELLEDIKVRNKYKSTPFVHSNLTNGDKWHYMAFPYTKNNVFTVDASNRGQATATNKLNQAAPPAPTISKLEFDSVTVTGGDEVSLNKTDWFTSPHNFKGLMEEKGYNAYAKLNETATLLESPASVAKPFTTPSDLPGPSDLIAGDMQAGYFGVVPASELFTGTQLASQVGITQGTSQFNDVGWLKFAIDGKIIFKSQKTYRHSISWDHIDSKGAVDGTKQVSKDGTDFKVRLMKGANKDPAGAYEGVINYGSEWNKLMLPIHEKAKDQSWAYKGNVKTPTKNWGINFTDSDLQVKSGDGRAHWCQEVAEVASGRLNRGGYGVSGSSRGTSSTVPSHMGWSPVLEVIS